MVTGVEVVKRSERRRAKRRATKAAKGVRTVRPAWYAKRLYEPHPYKCLMGGRSSGKALRDDTPIATPDGWTRMGDLRVGDHVFGADGKPVTVTGVFPQGERDEWAVDFRQGQTIYADGDHLWVAPDYLWRRRRRKRGGEYDDWRDVEPITTKQMAENVTHGKAYNHAVMVAEPLETPTARLPVDPYVLGVWLGDGIAREATLTCSAEDAPHFRRMFAGCGERLHEPRESTVDDSAPAYPITKTRRGRKTDPASALSRLRALGVLENKHIPRAYLRAAEWQRRALLAGLMDTDGTVDAAGSSATIAVTNRDLASDIYELVVSLGVRASFRDKEARIGERSYGLAYQVEFFPFPGCVTLPRKDARVRPPAETKRRQLDQRVVTSVCRTGRKASMTCISVDAPDRLFLAGLSMIPTHNTWAMAEALIVLGAQKPLQIACVREFQKSIHESAKRVLENTIRRLGLQDFYTVTDQHIDGANGTHFFFQGMERNRESIRGWEGVDIVWVEEAQRMSHITWELLRPTVMRNTGAEIWVSWNPMSRSDPVWRSFVINAEEFLREGAYIQHVNWYDKPKEWVGDEEDRERRLCMATEPERYNHIWNGAPDDEGAEKKVLPYARLIECVTGWRPEYELGVPNAGLDVADTGADWNALVIRRGPVIIYVERWRDMDTTETADRAHQRCLDFGMGKDRGILYFDPTGVGAGVRARMAEINPDYAVEPLPAGGAVRGKERRYTGRINNEEYFGRRKSQLAWTLRLRAENTRRYLRELKAGGSAVPPAKCLFIRPSIVGRETYLSEMCQPEWDNTKSGKLEIDKQPRKEGMPEPPSPDMYDGSELAYAVDSYRGLTAAA